MEIWNDGLYWKGERIADISITEKNRYKLDDYRAAQEEANESQALFDDGDVISKQDNEEDVKDASVRAYKQGVEDAKQYIAESVHEHIRNCVQREWQRDLLLHIHKTDLEFAEDTLTDTVMAFVLDAVVENMEWVADDRGCLNFDDDDAELGFFAANDMEKTTKDRIEERVTNKFDAGYYVPIRDEKPEKPEEITNDDGEVICRQISKSPSVYAMTSAGMKKPKKAKVKKIKAGVYAYRDYYLVKIKSKWAISKHQSGINPVRTCKTQKQCKEAVDAVHAYNANQ